MDLLPYLLNLDKSGYYYNDVKYLADMMLGKFEENKQNTTMENFKWQFLQN